MTTNKFIFCYSTYSLLSNFVLQADKKSHRNGGELVAEVLKAHDVKFLFTLCGGHISPVNVAAEKIGIRVVDTRHEVSSQENVFLTSSKKCQSALWGSRARALVRACAV